MKPKPLATLQVSMPALTLCACAGAPYPETPAATPSAPIATASFLSILSVSYLVDEGMRLRPRRAREGRHDDAPAKRRERASFYPG